MILFDPDNTLPCHKNIVNFQDYDIGGEEYLTFAGTRTNLGGGMDAKSGVFTVPQVYCTYSVSILNIFCVLYCMHVVLYDNAQAGAYMFTIHICTHDMKKGLLSLR